jgi:DNA end-binding protein Ku
MRSMANVNVTLGLISVPVKVYAATESGGVSFNQLHVHDSDGSAHRVNMPTVCSDCGEVVPRNMLAKGVERDGKTVVFTADELAAIEPEAARDFEVLKFVDAAEIDVISYTSPYFLEANVKANKRAVDMYHLIRQVLVESGRVGLVRYCQRGKQHLAVLRVSGKALVVQNVCWPSDVRSRP